MLTERIATERIAKIVAGRWPDLCHWRLRAPDEQLVREWRALRPDGSVTRWRRGPQPRDPDVRVEARERWIRSSEVSARARREYPERLLRYAAGRISEAYGLGAGAELYRLLGVHPPAGYEARAEAQAVAAALAAK